MYFRPFLWLTIFSLPALLVLLALGFWQLDRLAWKTALMNNFNERARAEADEHDREAAGMGDRNRGRVQVTEV